MKVKKRFYRSRKGMTLVELIVAMAIIVIVFSGVVWGITHGYATTVNNVTVDSASAKSQSVTDDVVEHLNLYRISSAADFDITVPVGTEMKKIHEMIENDVVNMTGAVYVDPSDFTNDTGKDPQYTIIKDQTTTITKGTTPTVIEGCIVKSAVLSTNGFIVTTSFVPYV
ncbi:MAG: type II secretion system protein [Acutalibacteraceae bacterium]